MKKGPASDRRALLPCAPCRLRAFRSQGVSVIRSEAVTGLSPKVPTQTS